MLAGGRGLVLCRYSNKLGCEDKQLLQRLR